MAGMRLWKRCRSEPQIAQLVTLMTASRGSSMPGSETVSQRTSSLPCQTSAFMTAPSCCTLLGKTRAQGSGLRAGSYGAVLAKRGRPQKTWLQRARVAEAHEPAARLVPQGEPRRTQSADQAERPHRRQRVHSSMCCSQTVVGYANIEVMDVMEADIARQPVQRPWQGKPRGPAQ